MQLFKTKRTLKRDLALDFKTHTDIFGEYIYNRFEFSFEFHIQLLLNNYRDDFELFIERRTWSKSIELLLLLKLSEGDFNGFIKLINSLDIEKLCKWFLSNVGL